MALINWTGFEELGTNGQFIANTDVERAGFAGASWGTTDHLTVGGTDARKGGIALEGHDRGNWSCSDSLQTGVVYTVGFALSSNAAGCIFTLGDTFASPVSHTNAARWNIAIQRGTTNYELYYTGNSSTNPASPTATWPVPTQLLPNSGFHEYQYWEIKFELGEVGSYELRVDGVTIHSQTGVNMNELGAVGIRVLIGNSNTGSTAGTRIDDFYLLDDTGSAPYNTFLGAVHVERLYPSSAGSSAGFTPLSGSNHENVDEEGQGDGDTSYNSTSSTGDKDLFNMGDLQNVNGGSVLAVRQVTQARKDASEDTINLTPVIKSGATEIDGDQRALLTGYDYVRKDYTANPTTSSAWTESEVNSLEAGYKSS